MRLRIQHRWEYRYAQPVKYSALVLRLTPRRDNSQHTLNWTLHAPGRRTERLDAHGNITHLLTLEEPHRFIEVVVTGVVDIGRSELPLPHEGPLAPLAYLATTALTRPSAALLDLAHSRRPAQGANWEWITGLGRALHEQHPDLAPGPDLAHAYLACCRAAGVPARYISGYRQIDEERSDRGAWVDIWSASQDGWIALDVQHLEPARSRHCRLAVGRDSLDAAPVRIARPGESVETLRIRDQ